MWAEINGERKKVACGPCIRGHRSSKCDHRDRVLVEVRKPGRPLSSCPHPSGSCSCERVVINYTIPKTSECACPSDRPQPATVAGSNRVQKSRTRKSSVLNPASLEKAIKASQDAETDTSSITRTPTERSASNEASPPSSASSTPRLAPSQRQEVSSCCTPKPTPPAKQGGSCCSSKAKETPKPIQKSCCSGPTPQQPPQHMQPQAAMNQNFMSFAQQTQATYQNQFQGPPYNMMPPQLPFNTTIYNHVASGYHQPSSIPLPIGGHSTHTHNHARSPSGHNHNPEHNCHCGDSCSCFGCAAHPNNATMMEYIRLMHHYMSTGGFGAFPPPTYDVPAYPHQPGYGAEAHQNLAFSNPGPNTFTQLPPAQLGFQANIGSNIGATMGPINVSSPWQPQSAAQTPIAEPPFMSRNNSVATVKDTPFSPKSEDPVASPIIADSPSEGKDEETPTLSPSSYFWSELVLPGCNDATGTCQCGDGCECVGCLTHGGHNGVPLDGPSLTNQEAFPDFSVDQNLEASASHFTAVSGAPT